MTPRRWVLGALACCCTFAAAAQERCSGRLEDASRWLAAAAWRETSMGDGKPLVLTLAERDGRLFVRFVKVAEGLWAEGHAEVCAGDGRTQVRMRHGELVAGPAAGWLVRRALLQGGARFDLSRLPDGRLRVATPGWSGEFVRDP